MELLALAWDFIVHLDRHLAVLLEQYGPWIYAIIFLVIFCETGLVVTPFLPGDSLLFVAGTLWATSGMSVHLLAALIVLAAFCGDNLNYFVGRKLGLRLFKPDSRFLNRGALEKTQAFYAKYGPRTVIMARFVPLVRTFAPFVAGIGRMHYPRFILFSLAGSLLWVGLLVYGGYFFGNIPIVKNNLSWVILAIIVISVGPIVIELLKARLAKP
jgi:membrane-associated protein